MLTPKNYMSVKKTVYISESNNAALKELKETYGFSSESDAVNYLIANAQDHPEKKIAQAVRKELEENYLEKDRIKWASQTAEQNTIIILDAINTILHKEKIRTCISVEVAPSPVVTQSRERIRERIHYFKQKSDERKREGKTRGSGMTPKGEESQGVRNDPQEGKEPGGSGMTPQEGKDPGGQE